MERHVGRRSKYPPGHPKFKLNLQLFPPGLSSLIARAAKVMAMQPRTFCYSVLAREAVYTLIAAQNRPLKVRHGGRIWFLDEHGTWRIAVESDGRETFLIQSQLHDVPQFIGDGGVAVSGLWIGHGEKYVVSYEDLLWDGRPPSDLGVKAFFRNLFAPGALLHEDPPLPVPPPPVAGGVFDLSGLAAIEPFPAPPAGHPMARAGGGLRPGDWGMPCSCATLGHEGRDHGPGCPNQGSEV